MKTAASITLLLQALVPAVALSRSGAHLAVTGGTDVPWSPTLDYLSYVVRPAYELLGIRFSVVAERRGYYPRGGGRVKVEVEPSKGLRPLLLTEPRPLPEVNVVSRCANLPRHVAERQMDSMERAFSKRIQISYRIVSVENAASPGSTTLAYSVEPGRIIGADALGARGRPAEDVGMAAAHAFIAAAESRACVDNNLADMIAPLLSLSEEESVLRVPTVSLHLRTSLHVARQFTGCEYSWSQEHNCVLLSIRPVPGHNV
jgi:RNA 3'-phosphate cyclase